MSGGLPGGSGIELGIEKAKGAKERRRQRHGGESPGCGEVRRVNALDA